MNLTKILGNVMSNSLQAEPFDTFKDYFNSNTVNEHDENVAQLMENACKKADPAFKPLTPEEKAIRIQQHERAKDLVPRVIYNTLSPTKDLKKGQDRTFYSFFFGMGNTPEDKIQKDKIIHAYNEGTPQERHALFLSAMNDLADFDLDQYRAMSIDQKLDRLPIILPKLYRAMESQNLINDFQRFNCGITPEEETRFTTLYKTLSSYTGELFAEMNMVLNPYYADLDLERLRYDDATLDSVGDDLLEQGYILSGSSMEEYKVDCGVAKNCADMNVTAEVFDAFRRNGVDLDYDKVGRCTSEGTPILPKDDPGRYEKALKNGETLYFFNNTKDSNREIMAFRDIFGKGYPTEITMEQAKALEDLEARKPIRMAPVPKPNSFVMFFDSINRLFRGNGFESVNNYNRYVRDCETFDNRMGRYQTEYREKLDQIRQTAQDRVYTDSFNKAAEETKALKRGMEQRMKGRTIASSYMLRGKLTPEQNKWAMENPDAFRDGFSLIKEDIIAASEGKLTEDDKAYLADIDNKIQQFSAAPESKEAPQLMNASQKKHINEENPEISSPQKISSLSGTISLP